MIKEGSRLLNEVFDRWWFNEGNGIAPCQARITNSTLSPSLALRGTTVPTSSFITFNLKVAP